MSKNSLLVRNSDGTSQTYPINGRMTLGTEGDIAIEGASHLSKEHLLLVPQGPNGCWVAHGEDLPVMTTLEGALFEKGIVPWGGVLELGSLELHFIAASTVASAGIMKRRNIIAAAAVVVMGLVSFLGFSGRDTAVSAPIDSDVPSLFAGTASCPQQVSPKLFAEKILRDAYARAERYPYDQREGVSATLSYRTASTCLQVVDENDRAKDAERASKRLQTTVESDFAVEQVRLRRALRADEQTVALDSVRSLLEYTNHLGVTPYSKKLQSIERELQRRLMEMEGNES